VRSLCLPNKLLCEIAVKPVHNCVLDSLTVYCIHYWLDCLFTSSYCTGHFNSENVKHIWCWSVCLSRSDTLGGSTDLPNVGIHPAVWGPIRYIVGFAVDQHRRSQWCHTTCFTVASGPVPSTDSTESAEYLCMPMFCRVNRITQFCVVKCLSTYWIIIIIIYMFV